MVPSDMRAMVRRASERLGPIDCRRPVKVSRTNREGDVKPWGKRNIEISSLIDGEPRYTATRSTCSAPSTHHATLLGLAAGG